ncbi:MAG: hypothetical protein GYB32_05835 [Algicola sp.]|nr:hypothetical protein [Algicola sp.]
MNPIIKNILAIVLGWLFGSFINMGLVQLGHSIFPIEGVDMTDMQALAEAMPNLSSKHFIFPFLAHAGGTFIGAIIAALIAFSHKMKFALAVGVLFLLGGIVINLTLSGPTWFTVVDLLAAYIPMAWLGGKIGTKFSKRKKITQ